MTIEKVSQQHSEVRASNFDRVTRISHSQLVISSFFSVFFVGNMAWQQHSEVRASNFSRVLRIWLLKNSVNNILRSEQVILISVTRILLLKKKIVNINPMTSVFRMFLMLMTMCNFYSFLLYENLFVQHLTNFHG